MNDNDQEFLNENANPLLFVAGMLVGSLLGGLIGALVMLLAAPQSGVKTRRQIRRKSRDLRTKAADTIEDGVGEVRAKTRQVVGDIHDEAGALQKRGEDLVGKEKERWTSTVEAGKSAINGS